MEFISVHFADMYYGGDSSTAQQAQSFTCSYCGTLGFTTAQLHDHIRSSHRGTATTEVVSLIALDHTHCKN